MPSREPESGQPTRKTIEKDEDGVIKSEFARKCISAFLAHADPWTSLQNSHPVPLLPSFFPNSPCFPHPTSVCLLCSLALWRRNTELGTGSLDTNLILLPNNCFSWLKKGTQHLLFSVCPVLKWRSQPHHQQLSRE